MKSRNSIAEEIMGSAGTIDLKEEAINSAISGVLEKTRAQLEVLLNGLNITDPNSAESDLAELARRMEGGEFEIKGTDQKPKIIGGRERYFLPEAREGAELEEFIRGLIEKTADQRKRVQMLESLQRLKSQYLKKIYKNGTQLVNELFACMDQYLSNSGALLFDEVRYADPARLVEMFTNDIYHHEIRQQAWIKYLLSKEANSLIDQISKAQDHNQKFLDYFYELFQKPSNQKKGSSKPTHTIYFSLDDTNRCKDSKIVSNQDKNGEDHTGLPNSLELYTRQIQFENTKGEKREMHVMVQKDEFSEVEMFFKMLRRGKDKLSEMPENNTFILTFMDKSNFQDFKGFMYSEINGGHSVESISDYSNRGLKGFHYMKVKYDGHEYYIKCFESPEAYVNSVLAHENGDEEHHLKDVFGDLLATYLRVFSGQEQIEPQDFERKRENKIRAIRKEQSQKYLGRNGEKSNSLNPALAERIKNDPLGLNLSDMYAHFLFFPTIMAAIDENNRLKLFYEDDDRDLFKKLVLSQFNETFAERRTHIKSLVCKSLSTPHEKIENFGQIFKKVEGGNPSDLNDLANRFNMSSHFYTGGSYQDELQKLFDRVKTKKLQNENEKMFNSLLLQHRLNVFNRVGFEVNNFIEMLSIQYLGSEKSLQRNEVTLCNDPGKLLMMVFDPNCDPISRFEAYRKIILMNLFLNMEDENGENDKEMSKAIGSITKAFKNPKEKLGAPGKKIKVHFNIDENNFCRDLTYEESIDEPQKLNEYTHECEFLSRNFFVDGVEIPVIMGTRTKSLFSAAIKDMRKETNNGSHSDKKGMRFTFTSIEHMNLFKKSLGANAEPLILSQTKKIEKVTVNENLGLYYEKWQTQIQIDGKWQNIEFQFFPNPESLLAYESADGYSHKEYENNRFTNQKDKYDHAKTGLSNLLFPITYYGELNKSKAYEEVTKSARDDARVRNAKQTA